MNVDDIAISIENNEGEWLNFNDAYGSCPRIFNFNISPDNYVNHEREAKVIFRYERYNLSDTLLVTLPAPFLKAGKREYHGVDNYDWPITVTLTSNLKPDQLSVNVISDNASQMQCQNPYWENEELGQIAMRVHNLEQLEEIGQTREAKIAITEKISGCSDTISVFFHYARVVMSNSNIFYQPGEDIVELPVQTAEKMEITECDDMPECLHRLPDGEMTDGFVLRYQLDANNTDEGRRLSLRLKFGDSEMGEGIYINQLDRNAPSADQQREALKAFYKAVEGKDWNHQWDDKPLSECDGVENAGNYIMWLDFGNSQMTGNLPEKELVMLMDAMPATSYNPRLILNGNDFYGKIPEKVVSHPRWQEFGWSIICQSVCHHPQFLDVSNCNLQLSNWEVEDLNEEKQWSNDLFARNKLSIVMGELPSNEMIERLHIAYHNKGLGTVAALRSGNWAGTTKDEYLKQLNEYSVNDIATTWNWDIRYGELNGLGLGGSWYLIDSESRIVGFLGRDWGIPESWYISVVDSICRSRLGDPDEVGTYTSSDYSRDGEVITLQKASVGRGIDLVFMGDAYVDRDMETGGKYEEDMRKGMEYFFAVEPYKSLRDRFNVYLVKVVSPNEYIGEGYEQRINFNEMICYEYAQKIEGIDMDNVTITTIIKPKDYYQRSYASITAGSAVCFIFQGPSEVIVHEAGGHCIGKLGDEYLEPLPDGERYISEDEREAFRKALYDTFQVAGIYLNLSATDNPDEVPWAHMLKDERYKDEVGIYQGAWLYPKDLWRSSENSIMRDSYYGWFNAPSRELIYKRVMQLSEGEGWTYDYEKFVEFDTPVRETYKQQTRALRQAVENKNAQKRCFDTKPPTFYKGTWRDAGKVEPITFIFSNKNTN